MERGIKHLAQRVGKPTECTSHQRRCRGCRIHHKTRCCSPLTHLVHAHVAQYVAVCGKGALIQLQLADGERRRWVPRAPRRRCPGCRRCERPAPRRQARGSGGSFEHRSEWRALSAEHQQEPGCGKQQPQRCGAQGAGRLEPPRRRVMAHRRPQRGVSLTQERGGSFPSATPGRGCSRNSESRGKQRFAAYKPPGGDLCLVSFCRRRRRLLRPLCIRLMPPLARGLRAKCASERRFKVNSRCLAGRHASCTGSGLAKRVSACAKGQNKGQDHACNTGQRKMVCEQCCECLKASRC